MEFTTSEKMVLLDPAIKDRIYSSRVFDINDIADAKDCIMQAQERWEKETLLLTPMLDGFGLTANDLVLDYGCGIGRMAKALIERFSCKVVGVDISSSMRFLAGAYVNDPRFVAVPAKHVGGYKFDAAISIWVLQHCHKPEEDIAVIHRQLKDGGKLAVVNDKRFRFVPYIRDQSDPTKLVFDWFDDQVDIWSILDRHFDKQAEQEFPNNGKLVAYDKRA